MFYRYRDTHLLRVGDTFSSVSAKRPLVFPKAFFIAHAAVVHPAPSGER
jgi:hypothetical protein